MARMSTANDIRKQQAERRRARLKEFIRLHLDDKQKAFIDLTGINQGELSALLKDKSFGGVKARGLEKSAHIIEGSLDMQEGAPFYESGNEHIPAITDESKKSQIQGMIEPSPTGKTGTVELLTRHVGDSPNFHRVYVVGKAQGGLPERIWTDGDHLVGAIDEYAELATPDPQAFICPVVGDSMYPRYMPGEYVLVEPNTPPRVGGTVLVRLATGETMLKKLDHRANGHVHLSSWNDPVQHTFREEDISWIYYVAHMVPPEKIKMRF